MPYTRHVNQVQDIIWVLPKGVVKNDVAIYKSGSNNPKIKYCLFLLSEQVLQLLY